MEFVEVMEGEFYYYLNLRHSQLVRGQFVIQAEPGNDSPGSVHWGAVRGCGHLKQNILRDGPGVVALISQSYRLTKLWGKRILKQAKGMILQKKAWAWSRHTHGQKREGEYWPHQKKAISASAFPLNYIFWSCKTYHIICLSNVQISVFLS